MLLKSEGWALLADALQQRAQNSAQGMALDRINSIDAAFRAAANQEAFLQLKYCLELPNNLISAYESELGIQSPGE